MLTAVAASMLWFVGPRTVRESLQPELKTKSETSLQAVPPPEIDVVKGIGYVEPISEIRRAAFKSDGVVDAVLVEVGQVIKQGDVLARLVNREEQAALCVLNDLFAHPSEVIGSKRLWQPETNHPTIARAEVRFARANSLKFDGRKNPVTALDLADHRVTRKVKDCVRPGIRRRTARADKTR